MHRPKTTQACPCGTGRTYAQCCEPLHMGFTQGQWAQDAEQLMRSRYSAYALGLEAYLLATWHPSTRPVQLTLEDDHAIKWIRLQIIAGAQQDKQHATVEFIAHYKHNGKAEKLHECSRFRYIESGWKYLDGEIKGT